jgi:hypothetical protein
MKTWLQKQQPMKTWIQKQQSFVAANMYLLHFITIYKGTVYYMT